MTTGTVDNYLAAADDAFILAANGALILLWQTGVEAKDLTLNSRDTDLTIYSRTAGLTLDSRQTGLTLDSRDTGLILNNRDTDLTITGR